tara:strand:+ start:8125 stop:8319 length:195 start_codon:yes stop_codon:yes gene_type:complete
LVNSSQRELLLDFKIKQLTQIEIIKIVKKSIREDWLENPKELIDDWNYYLFLLNNNMLGETNGS